MAPLASPNCSPKGHKTDPTGQKETDMSEWLPLLHQTAPLVLSVCIVSKISRGLTFKRTIHMEAYFEGGVYILGGLIFEII